MSIVDESWTDPTRERPVPARVYVPAGDGPWPLVVFSHGFGETNRTYAFLGDFWSKHGFMVAVVNHQGSDETTRLEIEKTRNFSILAPFRVRPQDLSFVIDQLVNGADPALAGSFDPERIGVAGHSLGSSTSLAMVGLSMATASGERITFDDARVRCAIAMSPQVGAAAGGEGGRGELGQGLDKSSWANIQRPAMLMMGTKDRGLGILREHPELRRFAFDALPPGDKYLVNIKNVQHHAFTDTDPYYGGDPRDPRHYGWIEEVTLAFFNAYLNGDEAARTWLKNDELQKATGGEVMQEHK